MGNQIRLIQLFMLAFFIGCEGLELSLSQSAYMNTKLGNPSGGNSIKLFDVASDNTRNKIYVQSILSPHIAVINADTDETEKYIDSKIDGYHLAYMAVQESTGHLFIADRSNKKLIKMDPESGKVLKEIDLSETGTPTKIAFLQSKGYVLIAFSSKNKIIAYRASTLSQTRVSLGEARGIFGPQGMKIINNNIYVALTSDGNNDGRSGINSNSSVAIINSSDWSTKTLTVPYKGADEIAVDEENERYFVMNKTRISMISSTGDWETKSSGGVEFKAVEFIKGVGLVLLTRNGEDSEVDEAPFGSLEVRDPETLDVKKSIRLGMRSSRMITLSDSEKIYVSNMAQGEVSSIHYDQLKSNKLTNNLFKENIKVRLSPGIKSIDVGTSIEAFVLHPNGVEAFLINRLGGSSLLHYNYETKKLTEIETRNWPAKIQISKDREEIYVFSHFASAVEIFDINSLDLKGTIELTEYGLEQGKTDLIAEMAFNEGKGKLYISLPEQGKIIEANVASKKVTQISSAFAALNDSGDHASDNHVGTVQLAVDSISHRLFVFYRNSNKLDILDPLDGLKKKKSYSMVDKVPSADDEKMFNANLISIDSVGRRFFFGPHIYEISAGDIEHKKEMKYIDSIIGYYDDYIIGADIDEDKSIKLKVYEKKSTTRYKKIMSDTVADMITNPPKFKYAQETEKLFVSYMSRGKLLIYNVDEK